MFPSHDKRGETVDRPRKSEVAVLPVATRYAHTTAWSCFAV
jgi:hypothetical protein